MMTLDEVRKHATYGHIPAGVLESVYGYVDHHQQPGHFLTAVFSNDLFGAVGRADKEAAATLVLLVSFIYNHVPCICYGDSAKISAWLKGRS